ncbi:MAG TPA: hypothetical protein ENI95_02990 [Chloroflexi bacterium]|nr:hypothetical protein [Chloroflexota bacterium]
MSYRIQVHLANDDPVILDVDELPKPTDQFVMGMNPQRRDGKDVPYILREVNQVIFPWWRINFIQILPSEQEEEIPTFVRE